MPLPLSQPQTSVANSLPLFFPLCGSRPRRIGVHRFGQVRKFLSVSSKSRDPSINSASTSDEELLQALISAEGAEDEPKSHLPAVRTYENDLARFSLIGAVDLDQALIAAAADGGDTAREHLSSGLSTMVIETLYPGSNPRSTVATRLFLPSREVKEKARQIKLRLSEDVFSGTTSRNILAMTFRQVMIHRVLSFELELFAPGVQRNMEDLSTPREISSEISLSSENLSAIVALAEAICSCALDSTKSRYIQNKNGESASVFSGWFQKPRVYTSSDSMVCVYAIPEDEIIKTGQQNQVDFIAAKAKSAGEMGKKMQNWWGQPTYSRLCKIGGPALCEWANEYVPAYRLQINGEKLGDVKLRGWEKLAEDKWEVPLTHFQMVELADILDMFFEDQYTLPTKQLSSGLIAPLSGGNKNEGKFSWKLASAILLGGCLLVSLRIMAQISPQSFFKAKTPLVPAASISGTPFEHPSIIYSDESDDLCLSVVRRVQVALGRPEAISVDKDIGVWAGELPTCLRKSTIAESVVEVVEREESLIFDPSLSQNSEETNPAQDIASYQVVLSREGTILGFQPTSRTAVPHWASNPLAAALHRGKKLSPGILEPTAKIPRPQEVVVVELLLSVNPDSWFILSRPTQQPTV
ncbi:deneddylase [Wolffia australiana]